MAENAVKSYKVVVIGGSAGSLEVILGMLAQLPPRPDAVFIIVLHRKNDKDSILENLLTQFTQLPVREVEDKEPIQVNHFYIAPPDYHLLIESEHSFSLDSSEKINFSRPSIDVTFESVAETFQHRVIGVLLSGANADGAQGLLKIKAGGGTTIVQNPDTADMAFMPRQAIKLGAADLVVDAKELMKVVLTTIGEQNSFRSE